MIRFEDIHDTVKRHHPEADLELLRKAYIFSAVEHKGQTRASGEPYLVHPLEVAAILADMRMDPVCVAVGLLHDVLEDTLTDPERLKEYFGPDVLHIVEGVTKIGKIPLSTSEERQAENYRKMLLAMVDDIRVILVKLADRLHNMRTLQYLPEERPGADRPRDHGHLRPHRGPARHEQDQERAGGARLPVPRPDDLQGPGRAGRGAAPAGHGLHREDQGHGRGEAAGGGGRGDGRGTHQAPPLHPSEAPPPAHRPRPGLRLRRPAGPRRRPSPTATPRWACSTTSGARCPAASRTSSPCRGPTATSRSTPR